jgi:hypothetical protein
LARAGFATFMQRMLARLMDQLRLQTLTPEGQTAVARFTGHRDPGRVVVCPQAHAVGGIPWAIYDDRTGGGRSPRHVQRVRR